MYEQRRPSRRDRKNAQVRKAFGIFIILSIVVAGAAHFYMAASGDIRPVDEATFCPTDSKGPSSVTAILIDRTDSFNPTQEAAIKDRLNEIRDETARYGLIEVYTVEPTQKELLKPIFSMCSPGRGEDVSKWTGNPHLVEERWQTSFADPLKHLLDFTLSGETAQVSPIMESIQSIAVTRLGSQEFVAKKIPRHLIVISDLMQYVQDYTQYKPFYGFSEFRKTPYYQSVRSDLSGITVDIWYVRRESTLKVQGSRHIDFWRDYLSDQGANVDKIWYVPGT